MKRVLFIAHGPHEGPGLLWNSAESHGLEPSKFDAVLGHEFPPLDDFDLIVTLGSSESAIKSEAGWVRLEQQFLETAVEADVPIVGICFGAQLLCVVLGGTVGKSPNPEIGWRRLHVADKGVVGPGPWFQWHSESLVPPSGAEILAWNESGVQAFRKGRHFGVQFHPEVTSETIRTWIAEESELLGLTAGSAGLIVTEFEAEGDAHVSRSSEFFGTALAISIGDS